MTGCIPFRSSLSSFPMQCGTSISAHGVKRQGQDTPTQTTWPLPLTQPNAYIRHCIAAPVNPDCSETNQCRHLWRFGTSLHLLPPFSQALRAALVAGNIDRQRTSACCREHRQAAHERQRRSKRNAPSSERQSAAHASSTRSSSTTLRWIDVKALSIAPLFDKVSVVEVESSTALRAA